MIPKFVKANMDEERAKIAQIDDGSKKAYKGKLIELDGFGFAAFSFAAIIGTVVGKFVVPGTTFSLTTTGGCLMVALVIGHFGRIGKISLMPQEQTLKIFRELGLMLFLVGAGIPGGAEFVAMFDIMYFVYGEEGWSRRAVESLIASTINQQIAQVQEQTPMKVTYKKIALGSPDFEAAAKQ